ncbi:Male gamete fusion factor family protein [Leishmania donovani]|uniref:Male gamete fusion factor family protein n=1 Tax=Leishmania donovani TaxID=5661 RepID=A0A504XC27_LEIDO|nr:Male gamete fusion factor family protein [Leishmania donovani]
MQSREERSRLSGASLSTLSVDASHAFFSPPLAAAAPTVSLIRTSVTAGLVALMPRAYVVTRHPAATENAMPHHRAHSSEGGKSGVLPSSRVSLLAILCGYLALTAALVASEPARKNGLVALLVWVYRMTRETMRAYLAPQSRCSLCRSPKPRRHALAQVTVCIAVLCVSLLVRLACPARAAFVSSSLISYCSDSGDENISCTKKMVVTVTVEGEQLPGEESLLFLNSATDMTVNNGTAVQFSPLRITTSRSAVRYRYPLFYVQNYNAKPYEATVKGSLLNQCNADFNADTATCGLAYDAAGKAIPYSQGFCCDCSMCQTLGLCQPDARANAACNIFDKYTTASCLRFAQRWYSGYTIGGYMTWYTVNLTLSRNVSGSGGAGAAEKVVMHLSPSNNGETAGEGWDVMARIVGTYAPVDQPLDLTSRMLFAPAIPPNDARVQAGAAEWLLLPTNLVTLDGRECDKVGVSYEAFASQGNKCNLRPGSCLSSQLEDYRTADLQRIAAGNKGQYMATSFGDFNLENDAATSPYISYLAASPAATMISITVSADDLEYTVGLASGKIVSADLNKPTLQAGTADGVMTVMVRNTAAVTGRLVVGMLNCSDGVFPMTAQKLSLAAQQQAAVTFKVYVQNSYASGKASCTVVVRNAHEAITDLRVVSWKLILLDLFVYLLIIAVVLCVIFFWRVFCCCLYLLGRQHRRGSGGEAEPKNEASRWGGCWKRRGESGGTSSSRHTDHKNSGSSDAPLQAAAPVSPAPPSAPAMMYVPTPICYEPAPFTTRSGGVEAASSAASFTPPLQALPPPPAVLHPLALMPPPRWCPYGNEEAVVPGEGPCAAHAFPPHSPIGSFAFAAPPACPALRYGEEWNRCGSATSMSPLTPSRSTQEGSPYNEEARCTPRAFQRSWASTPRPPQSPGANAPYL